VKKSM